LRRLAAVICAALTAGTLGFAPVLYAHPILDSKDAAVSISGTADMSINSTATNNVIKWVDFSIAKGEKVAFDANNYLNYVTGSARSEIYGMLTGGGNIYLVNPNGILIGDGATINVGSLYLSTKNLTADQLANYSTATGALLQNDNAAVGDVINLGNLNANSVTVEGNNITFKNIADVTDKTGSANKVTVNLTAGDTLRVGYKETGSFTNPTAPTPTNWASNKAIDWYILVASAEDYSRIDGGITTNNYMLGNDITVEKNTDGAALFNGTFDGLGHTITLPAGVFRPFDKIQAKGVVKNLGIRTENCSRENVSDGALALENYGRIENVWHTGDMTVAMTTNKDVNVGGIVAANYGKIIGARNLGKVTVTLAEGVTGNPYIYVGGIAGVNMNKGIIDESYNAGEVMGAKSGSVNLYAGGIAGGNGGKIWDVYNAAGITGYFAGGIAGRNALLNSAGTINYAYHGSGTVSGKYTNHTGGITGDNSYGSIDGTVSNSYYYAKDKADYKAKGGTYESVADDMKQAATFSNWSISSTGGKNKTWRIYEGKTRPLLARFLTVKDNYLGEVEYNGTATGDVGTHYNPSKETSNQAQTGGIAYGIDWVSDVTRVTPKELTVTNVNKTYDGTDTATIEAANLSGVVTGDTLTVSTTSANYADKNAGTGKTVTYGGLTLSGAKAKNYMIAADGTTTGNISPKEITATFADITKTYDGTTGATAGAGTLSDVVTGDTVTITGTANFADKNVGANKTVKYTGVTLGGTDAGNYTVAATAEGKGDITAKEITAIFADVSKTYDGATSVTAGTGSSTGIVTGDTVTITGTANFADKNVGTNKTVNYTGVALSGTDAANYSLVSNTAEGKGSIAKANITISTDAVTKTYDGTTTVPSTAAKVISGEMFGTDVISGGDFAFTDKNAGTNKTVTVSNVTVIDGNNGGNYNVTYAANTTSTINRKDAQVTFKPITKTYDGTTSATPGEAEFWGLIDADKGKVGVTADVAYEDKNVGTGKRVAYTNIALTGTEAQNYRLAQTYVNADNGTITRKALELVATPQTIAEGEATPTAWSGSVTGFVAGEGLDGGDTLSFALDNPAAAAVGSYKVTGTLSIDGAAPLTSGDYGTNYTFDNAAANATAFTIAAKYVPPAPTPTPSAPSGGNGGNTGNTGGNTGSTTPTNPTTPTVPTPIAPSGNTNGTTPNSGGNTSETGANPPAPLAAAEPVIVATVTETETIAAAAAAGATAEMTHIADNVRPTNIAEQPMNGGGNAAAAPLAAAVETAANAQDFTLTAGGLLAVSNENNSAPKDAMSVESIGHALSVLQHGSGEKSAATAPNTETKSAAGSIGSLEEAVEATDLAIGTEIAETDRESKAGQENLASDTGTAGGADESAEESDEKKKR